MVINIKPQKEPFEPRQVLEPVSVLRPEVLRLRVEGLSTDKVVQFLLVFCADGRMRRLHDATLDFGEAITEDVVGCTDHDQHQKRLV